MNNDDIPLGYTRVTDILSPFTPFGHLDPSSDFAKNAKIAAERGSRVHKLCEAHALGLFVPDCEVECVSYLEAFQDWFDYTVSEVIYTEQRINSSAYKLSGCPDMIVVLKGDCGASLIDIKTPAVKSLSWALQTAAYRMLAIKQYQLPIDRRIVLKLPKKSGCATVIEYDDHERDERLFFSAFELYRFFN